MEQFDIQIQSITKKEYVQAGTESIRRMTLPLLALVAVLTIIIAMAIQDFSYRSIVPPFGIALIVVFFLRFTVSRSWKNYPADTAYSFQFDQKGWRITVGEESVPVDWRDTYRMTVRRDVVLLYNESNRSNLLPRRCVSDAQLEQMRTWFKASRAEHKLRAKAEENRYREDYRARRREERARSRSRRRRR